MRNAEWQRAFRFAPRPSPYTLHSAFRIPNSAFGAPMKELIAGGGTGGLLMPALALAQALRDAGKGIEPALVGAERGVAELVPQTYPCHHLIMPTLPSNGHHW